MIKMLVKRFVKDYENTTSPSVRERYGVLGGILGIICNVVLFGIKLAAGTAMNSISVVSDAFNNLSDSGSSLISIAGAKLSNRRPDREHPFGHGRFEYIASLIVSFIILFVGAELLKSSVIKIFRPEPTNFSAASAIILGISVLVKLWMFSYNRYLGRQISGSTLEAAAADSLNDVIATSAVLLCAFAGQFTAFPIDGAAGTAVALMIIKTGFDIAKKTADLLIGASPDPETEQVLYNEIMAGRGVLGIHDLVVHDYGPGRVMASAHAEVRDTARLVEVHEAIDEIEERVLSRTGINLVLHADPVSVDCEETQALKELTLRKAAELNPLCSIHDFRIRHMGGHINVLFDMVPPPELSRREQSLLSEKLIIALRAEDERLRVSIKTDSFYIRGDL